MNKVLINQMVEKMILPSENEAVGTYLNTNPVCPHSSILQYNKESSDVAISMLLIDSSTS
jgi:hypothetical protein